jgi:hypothetical protein
MKINETACACYVLIALVASFVAAAGKIILISLSTMPTSSSYSYGTDGDHGENLKWHIRIDV